MVPNDPIKNYEDLLRDAVELSSEKSYKHKRASFWRWQREFYSNVGTIDMDAIQAALLEMNELVLDVQNIVDNSKIRTGIKYMCFLGTIAVATITGPLSAAAVAGVFLSAGQFAADQVFPDSYQENIHGRMAGALIHDLRKHFGWENL